jgi:hypothetical protein
MKVSVPRFERPVRGGIAAISVVLMFQNMIFSQPGGQVVGFLKLSVIIYE